MRKRPLIASAVAGILTVLDCVGRLETVRALFDRQTFLGRLADGALALHWVLPGVVCLTLLVWGIWPTRKPTMTDESEERKQGSTAPTIGKDVTMIGRVPHYAHVGDGSTIIGATDERGNTILTTPMAVGRDAWAGPGGISIGAGAGAGGKKD